MFDPSADVFFKDPDLLPDDPPATHGTLYALRRDIRVCLAGPAKWPGAMAVLAGIDLLGKFYAGDDDIGGVAERFRSFARYNFQLNPGEEEIIYQLRNSLLHSFGLYSQTKKATYRFGVTAAPLRPMIQETSPGVFLIDLLTLNGQFETSIQTYATKLEASAALQVKFSRMYPVYGSFSVSKIL